jgi:TrmH family RNA methyltransferase
MERITSRQNAIVKRFRELARASRAGAAEMLLDGEHLLQEALAGGVPIDVAAFAEAQLGAGSSMARLAVAVEARGARVLVVGAPILAAMSPVRQPSGVVAIARARAAAVDAIMASNGSGPALVAVLDGVQDPGNVGAIVRAAAAFGASGVIALDGSANPFGWKALRGAMGGTFRLPTAAGGSYAEAVAAARRGGVRVIAAAPRGGTPLTALDLRGPVALVLGGEGAGLPPEVLHAVDDTVTIPMHRPVESLNVAIAAALLLYEAARQRQR